MACEYEALFANVLLAGLAYKAALSQEEPTAK
jgi:hypothetical protein